MKLLLLPFLTSFLLKILGKAGNTLEPFFKNIINPTIIKGGSNINVLPDKIELSLDMRLIPGISLATVLSDLKLTNDKDIEIKIIQNDPVKDKLDISLLPLLKKILQKNDKTGFPVPFLLPAFTDGRLLTEIGIQTYGFTPMDLPEDFKFSEMIHAVNERIPVRSVEFGADCIYQLICEYKGDL